MPTENRSSNADPRDVFIRLNPLGLGEAYLRKDSTGFEDPRTHSDYLLFLAGYRESQQAQQHNAEPGYPPCDYCGITPDYHPWHGSGMINGVENRHIHACDGCRGKLPSHPGQPHPEPIAWMVGTAFWWTKEEAERDAKATGLPIVGLGPMTGIAPTEQHEGKPVVLPARREWNGLGNAADNLKAAGWNACLMAVEKLGPLYTHADPGEVERLRSMFDQTNAGLREVTGERDTLRAEADRLRQEVASIDKKLRGNVSDPDPLKPIMPGALSVTTTYGLVAGIVRERDQLKKALERQPS